MLANANQEILTACLLDGIRMDGRSVFEYRNVKFQLGPAFGQVEVMMGKTRVYAAVESELVHPATYRPNEGFYSFSVDLTAMANSEMSRNRRRAEGFECANFIEKILRSSRAIDPESLCVVGGQVVWSVSVHVHALHDDGNLWDACILAAIMGILHFRNNDVTVSGQEFKVHSEAERPFNPICQSFIPLTVSIYFYRENKNSSAYLPLIDPTLEEQMLFPHRITTSFTQQKDLCAIHHPGDISLSVEDFDKFIDISLMKCSELQEIIKESIKRDQDERNKAFQNIRKLVPTQTLIVTPMTSQPKDEESNNFTSIQFNDSTLTSVEHKVASSSPTKTSDFTSKSHISETKKSQVSGTNAANFLLEAVAKAAKTKGKIYQKPQNPNLRSTGHTYTKLPELLEEEVTKNSHSFPNSTIIPSNSSISNQSDEIIFDSSIEETDIVDAFTFSTVSPIAVPDDFTAALKKNKKKKANLNLNFTLTPH